MSINVLPALNAEPNTVTVSGFSAGAYFSHRLQIIFSEEFKGMAAFAGVPYYNI